MQLCLKNRRRRLQYTRKSRQAGISQVFLCHHCVLPPPRNTASLSYWTAHCGLCLLAVFTIQRETISPTGPRWQTSTLPYTMNLFPKSPNLMSTKTCSAMLQPSWPRAWASVIPSYGCHNSSGPSPSSQSCGTSKCSCLSQITFPIDQPTCCLSPTTAATVHEDRDLNTSHSL